MRFLLKLLSLLAVLVGVGFCAFLALSILKLLWQSKPESRDRVEVIELSGVIMSSTKILEELEEFEKDNHVRAVVLRINSPGGLVAPSQEIYNALVRTDKVKPVIASMNAVAASGGYYASLGARKVFANPGTLTASIGVIMEFANTQKLYQWAKIERYALKSGKFKDIGSPLREMSKEERQLIESMLFNIHDQFKRAVQERRKLSNDDLTNSTDGRIMTGEQALEAKLVDELGDIKDAIQEAKLAASLPSDAPVIFPQIKRGLLRKLFLGDDDPEEKLSFSNIGLLIQEATRSFSPSAGYRVWFLAPVV